MRKKVRKMTFKLELRRQFIHFLVGNIFLALVLLLGVFRTFEITVACLLLGLIISMLIKTGYKIPLFYQIVQKVEREHEKEWPGQGAILFFISAIIVMLVFQSQLIVLGALAALIYGDSASTVFGIKFGKHKLIGKRTVEGTVAGILAMLPILIVLFPIQVAVITAIIAMAAELLPINDNFTIPIAAAIVLKALGL
jgi:dolichol kinase